MNELQTSPELTAVRAFFSELFSEPSSVTVRFGDGTQLEAQIAGAPTIVINSPTSLRRMFRPPLDRSLSEAYIRGDFDIEGDFIKVFEIFHMLASKVVGKLPTLAHLWLSLPNETRSAQVITPRSTRLYDEHRSRERSRKATQYRYDAGNDFYALWLDTQMVYSCAYFSTGDEDLDTAQEHKLDLICHKLRLEPGERLLDIGCGWGGLVLHAAKHYGVNVLGITLRQPQQFFANQRIAAANLGSTVVKLIDYRDLTGGTFDKIASIGIFEHLGHAQLSEYFAQVYRLLKPGGLFLNQGISVHPSPAWREPRPAWKRLAENAVLGSGTFIQNKVFPDSELVPVSEVNLAAEKFGFEIYHLENLREHYVLTLRHWLKRLDDHRTQAIQLTDEATYRAWKLYMSTAIYGFETGSINVNQALFYKPLNSRNLPLPHVRHCHAV